MWCPPKARRFTSHSLSHGLCVDRASDANRSNLVGLVPITSCCHLVGLVPGSSCGRLVGLVPITSCGRRLFSTHPQTSCRAHRFAGSSLRVATSLRMPHPNTITLYRTLLCRIRTPLPQLLQPARPTGSIALAQQLIPWSRAPTVWSTCTSHVVNGQRLTAA